MTDTLTPPPPGDRIIDEPLSEALSRRYLAYALSVITDRALPDVRDGLKPVQRRVLYAMREMRLNPEATARKCAKVVGEVMGGYHPHGDQSIYDTLVRMAQDFAQRYPLVDGQGNFGNIDGDNPAAMRYTEAMLTAAATMLLDGIDESAEDVRLVLEPKSRNVEPEVLMESLFKLSDLETRFSVNLNVLDARGTPGVMGLRAILKAFLDHRREVLVRRARHRLGKIEARLHILDGLLIAYLNLDEVIRIVRYEDEPKAKLIETFALTEIQAEAILNTRLRQLARLEEMELRREHAELAEERDGIVGMLGSDKAQWALVGEGLKHVKAQLKDLNVRRSIFADAPEVDADAAIEALIVKEPITVILSDKGWIRAAKGRVDDPSELKFKEGDKLAFLVEGQTTDKLLIFASDGRFFTLGCDKLPSARGHGEPLRLMIDLEDRVGIVDIFMHRPGAKRVLAGKEGYGFILPEAEAIAFRRAGKQVLNGKALVCLPIKPGDDQVAVVGDNGKILVFPVDELPEMPRGKGVKLQSYREGGLRDAAAFNAEAGAGWIDAAGRNRDWPDWREWLGKRAGAGKLAPKGFPTTKRFRPR